MKPLFASILFILSFHSFGQETIIKQKDITLGTGLIFNQRFQAPSNTFNLTYRHELKKDVLLKVGANADYYQSPSQSFNTPISVSDSILILGRNRYRQKQFSGRIGVDYKASKIFYTGIELKLGYTEGTIFRSASGYVLDSASGNWQSCNECLSEYYGTDYPEPEVDPSQTNNTSNVRVSESTEYTFNYGLLFNMGLDFPLTEKLNFAVQGTLEVIFYGTAEPFSDLQLPTSVNLMLRYRI